MLILSMNKSLLKPLLHKKVYLFELLNGSAISRCYLININQQRIYKSPDF